MITESRKRKTFDSEGWVEVPSGTLAACIRRHQARTRLTQLKTVTGLCLVFAVGLGLGVVASQKFTQPAKVQGTDWNYGGITCSEVQKQLQELLAGKRLSPARQAQVEAHLAECPHCQKLRDRMMTPAAAAVVNDSPQYARAEFAIPQWMLAAAMH